MQLLHPIPLLRENTRTRLITVFEKIFKLRIDEELDDGKGGEQLA